MQHIKDYSKCFFCDTPVLERKYFICLNNIAICSSCCRKIEDMAYSADVDRITEEHNGDRTMAKILKHANELDW